MPSSSSIPPSQEQSKLSFATIQQANAAFNAGEFLQARELCTKALTEYTPYHPVIYANRACVYSRLGYHDLAAGDAYRAVMLMEYIRARYQDEVPQPESASGTKPPPAQNGAQQLEIDTAEFVKIKLSIMNEMNEKLEKAIADQAADVSPEKSRSILSSGVALRQNYPWNTYEPDRFSEESLHKLNQNMTKCALNSGLGVAKCEAKVLDLPDLTVQRGEDGRLIESVHLSKHLGIFATQDIYAEETFFVEDITISGAPHPGKRILCDYCSERIPGEGGEDVSPDPPLYPAYCSQLCLRLAKESHHNPTTLCGREDDLSWIYDDIIASPNPISMNNTHPLLLDEVKYLYGIPPPSRGLTMRWDFVTCVVRPMWILTQGLGIDIYSAKGVRMFDTWVVNTLLAKIMGTCSGRFEPLLGIQQECDDRPDVVNVHPTWSLVNHDCEPGVGWKPEGKGKFWGIARRGDEDVPKSLPPGEKYVAVKKGEEVKSCYTDRKLDYKVRREWARDMLGGDCVCARCLREEKGDLEQRSSKPASSNTT
ncbi:hypothetical protein DFH27DRAFT_477101 [Peziza echinospora]|nr:hypothetical protein DFH27DRAFT_477101 [Peziza echinospora]